MTHLHDEVEWWVYAHGVNGLSTTDIFGQQKFQWNLGPSKTFILLATKDLWTYFCGIM